MRVKLGLVLCVSRRTGGLESTVNPQLLHRIVSRRTGGLENCAHVVSARTHVSRRTGGLETNC